jgi:hypothetical protein
MYNSLAAASHWLPLLTSVIAVFFALEIFVLYEASPASRHLLFWGIGIVTFGIGTIAEALITLVGWHVVFFKIWYIFGALLGAGPLALGTLYLVAGRRAGNIGASVLATVAGVAAIFVILSPVDTALVSLHVPSGRVLVWQSVRLVTPFINGVAALVLIGGSFYLAFKRRSGTPNRRRFFGNLTFAIGALLPGIGGLLSRMGYTEILCVGELVGIILMWTGFKLCRHRESKTVVDMATAVPSSSTQLE